MKRGFRIRIYPTEEQKELLSFYCKTAHEMWNFLVAKYKEKLPVCGCYGIKDYTPRDLINEYGVEIPQRIAFGVMKTYCAAEKNVLINSGMLRSFINTIPINNHSMLRATQLKLKDIAQ